MRIMESTGFDKHGNPIDFIDNNNIIWVYVGKNSEGYDHWIGKIKLN